MKKVINHIYLKTLLIISIYLFFHVNIFAGKINKINNQEDDSLIVLSYLKTVSSGSRPEIRKFIENNFDSEFLKRLPLEYQINFQLAFYYECDGMGYELKRILIPGKNEIKALIVNNFTGAWLQICIPLSAGKKINNFVELKGVSSTDNNNAARLQDQEIIDRMNKCMPRIVKDEEFSGAVIIAKENQAIFEKAYGFADKSYLIPNKPDTKFNIASLGKMFTAVAVAQLAEQGRLSFTDPLSKYLTSDWLNPEISKKIQIRHLLTHTSGLGDYFKALYDQSEKYLFSDLDDYKFLVAHQTLAFEPGTNWSYSNTGMLLLGVIIEKITGMKYFDYLDKYIFQPSGMKNTGDFAKNSPVSNRALGYYKEYLNGEVVWKDNSITRVIKGSPSGGCYSTVRDLLNFDIALRENKLLSPEFTGIVLSAKPEIHSPFYGYGFFLSKSDDGLTAKHSGDGTGISCQFSTYPDRGYSVIVLSNYNRPSADIVGGIIEQLLAAR